MKRFLWLFPILMVFIAVPLLAQAQTEPPKPDVPIVDVSELYKPGEIRWQSCPENKDLQCGTLTLPVNYRKPKGKTFELAVIRAKSTDPSKRIGALFVHPGGHASGVDFVLAGVGAPTFENARQFFDIISLDPRGAGRTNKLDCGFDLPDLPEEQSDEALIAYFDTYSKLVAEQCLDKDREFVLSISGNNFARDIDAFRQALGERQLTFTMISNSGPVGAVYATLFPKRVRAMVIDSPVGPEFRDYWIHRRSEQSASLELAFQRIDQLCRRDAGCRLRENGVVATFDKLAAKLKVTPQPLPDGTTFTAEDLSDAVGSVLAIEGLSRTVVAALANAVDGNYALLVQLKEFDGSSDDGFTARVCNDYGFRNGAADYLPMDDVNAGLYPRFFGRFWIAYNEARCASWPIPDDTPIIGNVQHRVQRPIVVIGSEFDSDAPYAWTVRVADALGMGNYVVRYAGGGHSLVPSGRVPCINNVFGAFLFELKLPAKGTVCSALPISFAPPQAQINSEVPNDSADWNFIEPLLHREMTKEQ